MKRSLLMLTILCGLLVFSGSAWAYSVGLNDVGDVDTLKGFAVLNDSGDQDEVNWVNTVLGTSFILSDMTKTDIPSDLVWQDTDVTGIIAYDLKTDAPVYFFIKVGVGTNDPIFTHYLYENVNSFSWAVINLSVAQGITIKNIGKLSHLGELNETQVPEPTTLLLLGFGLVGLAGISRKLKK